MVQVCHLISGDLWAGAEVTAYHLLRGLQVYDDLTLSAILLNEGKLAEEVRKLGIRVHVVDESKTSSLNIFKAMRGILRKWVPDVVHSHRYKENILAYMISRSVPGLTLIATQHGKPGVHGNKLKHLLISKCNLFALSRRFQRIVAVSQEMKEAFVDRYGFREDRLEVINNGISIQDIPPKRHNGETFVIGSAGRLFPVKDYSLMVEIAKVISEKANKIHFMLAGDGPDRRKIQGLVKQYSLDDTFELVGHVENMAAFYEGLDLYVNTSIHEGIPISVLEAMAHGLPVVAPMVGGLPGIVDEGAQGYLLRERDPKVFAEKCLLLYSDKTLRKRMSKAAREKVSREFSMEQMVQKYHDLYLNLVSKG